MKSKQNTEDMLIGDTESLREVVRRFKGKSPLGFDTEFVREKTYYPRLEVFQIVVGDEIELVDCQSIDDLSPLWELLFEPATEKVVHSGMQDMELILQESGRLPDNVIDTQIAASLLGLGAQCGYSRLVSQVLGARVPKGETFSDWSQRPLHPDQLAYARADVEHLLPLRDALCRRLERRGRVAWLREECSFLSDPETHRRHEPEWCFLRIKGRSSLGPTSLSVLRSLAQWRELEARRRDVPPGRIMRDHALVALAKARPTSMEELKRQRGVHGGQIGRDGVDIVRVVQEGIERAGRHPVEVPESTITQLDGELDGLFKLMSAVLQIQAEQARIAPSVLATSQEIRDLIDGYRKRNLSEVRLLKGWRAELAGDMLLSVLQGRMSLRVEPDSGALVLEKVDD
jgi:ribonuclease D